MNSSGYSTPPTKCTPLPPIKKSRVDIDFINDLNHFIENELSKINTDDDEQTYLVWKAAFNKVIEHVVAYKPILTAIKKEYEDTIDTIKASQRDESFLQMKLKSMASEPSTLRNYKRRSDELEERIAIITRENKKLEQELREIQVQQEEKEKRPKTTETPKRQLKRDSRSIPGLTLEEITNMKVLQKKFEVLDRQLKELNISLKTRFLPKSNKVQLKTTLDTKVAYRDQLQHQSLVYKERSQRLKIALEAAQSYNQMKPPHQTVGDAVNIAFHQATGIFQQEKDKTEGEYGDMLANSTSAEDDDPNKEKEAEMMLEYIEKFNELFEDGLYEEAAVHASNSPKGILRTQATLAKFRDLSFRGKGRSPLLAFCDALMSSVKAAGKKPNEALSHDCVEAALNENRADMVHHWLAQDRLTLTHKMGNLISGHCHCQLTCVCECQAMAQSIFIRVKSHFDAVLAMLKQGKIKNAFQYARYWHCITSDKVKDVLNITDCPHVISGLLIADPTKQKPLLNVSLASIIEALMDLNKPNLLANLIETMAKQSNDNEEETVLPLARAVYLDKMTSHEKWQSVAHFLYTSGHHDSALQLFALTYVTNILHQSSTIVMNDSVKKGVSFSKTGLTKSDSQKKSKDERRDESEDTAGNSSKGVTPEMPPISTKSPRESILKKKMHNFDEAQNRKFSPPGKRVNLMGETHSPSPKFVRMIEHTPSEPQRPTSKVSGSYRLIESDPYTSNPESAEESEAE